MSYKEKSYREQDPFAKERFDDNYEKYYQQIKEIVNKVDENNVCSIAVKGEKKYLSGNWRPGQPKTYTQIEIVEYTRKIEKPDNQYLITTFNENGAITGEHYFSPDQILNALGDEFYYCDRFQYKMTTTYEGC